MPHFFAAVEYVRYGVTGWLVYTGDYPSILAHFVEGPHV